MIQYIIGFLEVKKLTKEQKKQIDDLYNMTNKLTNDMTTNIINKDKEEKKKAKERQKRIKQRKKTENNEKNICDAPIGGSPSGRHGTI